MRQLKTSLGNSFERKRGLLIDLLIFAIMFVSLLIIGYFTYTLVQKFGQITTSSKTTVMGNVSQGTLALGALALTVLAYAFAQLRLGTSTETRRPYKRIAYIMFFVVPLSMVDAMTSAIFVLTEDPLSFQVSLILLYMIVVGIMISVCLWARKELK